MTEQRYAGARQGQRSGGHQETLDLRTETVSARDVREFLIETVSQTGGHLGAGLGAVELAVALHYVFNTPYDKLVWDVGHQAYPHKILTGRKDRLEHHPAVPAV